MIVAGIAILVEASVYFIEIGAGILCHHVLQVVIAVFCITVCLMLAAQNHALVVGRCLIG